MKHIFAFILTLCSVATLAAQGVVRTGLYMENGVAVYKSAPQSSVTVSVTVKSTRFTPGEYARYAQKMLGVRASLAERVETEIVSATLDLQAPTTPLVDVCNAPATEPSLPIYKSDNRAQSVEQQAAAAADMIFAMRRHRKELITGDAGENVFGAGLTAALEQIASMEQQCLDLFYGTTTTTTKEYRYTITPTAAEKNYLLARYRSGVGMLSVADLSGDPIMVCFNPSAVDISSMPIATEKDKQKAQFVVPAPCKVELFVGTELRDALEMIVYQYGTSVVLALPSTK